MDGACWVCFCCPRSPVEDMNVKICWVHVMKCMCAQTGPLFVLSSGRVQGNRFRTHVNSKGKIPSTRRLWSGWNLWYCTTQDSKPNTLMIELFRPLNSANNCLMQSNEKQSQVKTKTKTNQTQTTTTTDPQNQTIQTRKNKTKQSWWCLIILKWCDCFFQVNTKRNG